MTLFALLDTDSQYVLTLDGEQRWLRLEIEGYARELRLKPYQADILQVLFAQHPGVVSYAHLEGIFGRYKLVLADNTRLHRKLSELRRALVSLHPSLKDLLSNARGTGYGLALRFKPLHEINSELECQFNNAILTHALRCIQSLIQEAIAMSREGKLLKLEWGHVMIGPSTKDQIAIFNQCVQQITSQVHLQESDFVYLRLQYQLAKLRTYIGLARISPYPISMTQWLEWFKQEVWLLFEECKRLLVWVEAKGMKQFV